MTFEQIFSGEMILTQALRHVAQAGAAYDFEGKLRFTNAAAEDAFRIIENALGDLRRERSGKRSRRRAA